MISSEIRQKHAVSVVSTDTPGAVLETATSSSQTITFERRENAMSIMSKVLRQCRKPTGWLGRIVVRGMNMGHSEMTNWGLGHISIRKNDTILDVGCGGGGTIRKLARIATEGKVHGIDYSEESVRICTKTNRRLI